MALMARQDLTKQVETRRVLARHGRWSRYSNKTFYLFIAPWLLGFFFLTLFPMGYALVISFTNFDGMSEKWRFIGLRNYVQIFHDPTTWLGIERTLIFTVLIVPATIAGGLILALLLNRPWKIIGLFRSVFYLPAVIPVVGSAIAWKLMFDRDVGAINALIERLGGPAIVWLVDPTAFSAMLLMTFWGLGGGMIISLAGLQGIPAELREAARVDGANRWQTFFAVTLPLLSPVLFFQVVTGIIASLQTLVQPLLLSAGYTSGNQIPTGNYLYMVNVYEQIFANQRFGYGMALLWVFIALILLITFFVFRTGGMFVYYEAGQEK